MGRYLLELAGYDPDEAVPVPTPEDAIGAAAMLYVMTDQGGLPDNEADFQKIAHDANFMLKRAGLEPKVTVELVEQDLDT